MIRKKIILFVIYTLVSTVGQGASNWAYGHQQVFDNVEFYRVLIKQAEARIAELSGDGTQRVSNKGAMFTLDESNPDLGVAYRDPHGLIWGDIILKGELITWQSANDTCKKIGARLPSKYEFSSLSVNLGGGSAVGYSSYLLDGRTDFLPNLANYSFWTSTESGHRGSTADVFANGYSASSKPKDAPAAAARCVVGPVKQ